MARDARAPHLVRRRRCEQQALAARVRLGRCRAAAPALLRRHATVSDPATKGAMMHLDHIALGGTYQVETPFVRDRTVHVEAVHVHYMGAYPCLEQVVRTAFVWVYESRRGLRYSVSPQALWECSFPAMSRVLTGLTGGNV